MADKEVREAFNTAIRRGFGRGPQAVAQEQERARQIDDMDEKINQRQAQLDRQQKELDQLVERRDAALFEKEEKGAK